MSQAQKDRVAACHLSLSDTATLDNIAKRIGFDPCPSNPSQDEADDWKDDLNCQVAHLVRDFEELKQENAKLKEENAKLNEALDEALDEEYAKLKEENAKFKERVLAVEAKLKEVVSDSE